MKGEHFAYLHQKHNDNNNKADNFQMTFFHCQFINVIYCSGQNKIQVIVLGISRNSDASVVWGRKKEEERKKPLHHSSVLLLLSVKCCFDTLAD